MWPIQVISAILAPVRVFGPSSRAESRELLLALEQLNGNVTRLGEVVGESDASLNASIENLQKSVDRLDSALRSVETGLTSVDALISTRPWVDSVEVRDISRQQAKEEIRDLFLSGQTLYYSDIAEGLQIELPLVVELCRELQDEGEIEVDADALRDG